MSRWKTLARKLRLVVARKKARGSPRWVDLRTFGLSRARFKSVQRYRKRHWRRTKIKK